MIRGRLDPEVGAVLSKALEAAAEALYAGGAVEPEAPAEARRADALGLVAESALGDGLGARPEGGAEAAAAGAAVEPGGSTATGTNREPAMSSEAAAEAARPSPAPVVGRAERFQVVVHVSAETSRRLACDAGVVAMTHDREGNVLDVGRRRRSVPPALPRALDRRDGGCRFPGCASRYCDAHHIRHCADGGETKLGNLALVCRHHHRLLHEDGWRAERREGGVLRFYRPDGRLLPQVPAPAPLREDRVAALERDHRGLGIHSWTPTPRWLGEPLHVDRALFTLRRPSEEAPGAGVSAETRATGGG